MRRRPISGGEAFSGYDESRGVWSKVEEKLGDDVESEKGASAEFVVCETHDAEDDGQNDEATDLDGLATNGINESHGEPITRYCTMRGLATALAKKM